MSELILRNVRLSFPSLFNRSMYKDKEGKYEATFLISKDDTKTKAKIDQAIKELMAEHQLKAALPSDRVCLRDGDTTLNKDGEIFDGYAGNWSFKAASNKAIQIVDRDKMPIVEKDNKVYAGCYVNAVVSIWYQNNAYGRRINGNLYAVQFVKDGDAFGLTPTNVANIFENLDGENDLDF